MGRLVSKALHPPFKILRPILYNIDFDLALRPCPLSIFYLSQAIAPISQRQNFLQLDSIIQRDRPTFQAPTLPRRIDAGEHTQHLHSVKSTEARQRGNQREDAKEKDTAP